MSTTIESESWRYMLYPSQPQGKVLSIIPPALLTTHAKLQKNVAWKGGLTVTIDKCVN